MWQSKGLSPGVRTAAEEAETGFGSQISGGNGSPGPVLCWLLCFCRAWRGGGMLEPLLCCIFLLFLDCFVSVSQLPRCWEVAIKPTSFPECRGLICALTRPRAKSLARSYHTRVCWRLRLCRNWFHVWKGALKSFLKCWEWCWRGRLVLRLGILRGECVRDGAFEFWSSRCQSLWLGIAYRCFWAKWHAVLGVTWLFLIC